MVVAIIRGYWCQLSAKGDITMGTKARSAADRLRHAISFEVTALVLVTPLASWVFGLPLFDVGIVSMASAIIAMLWNYIYNMLFDVAMVRFYRDLRKTIRTRIVHTVLFECGLLFATVPFISWYLGISLLHAFRIDVAVLAFFLVYTYVFNWAYDTVFPLPAT
jgi:uncharacterized membrane protein